MRPVLRISVFATIFVGTLAVAPKSVQLTLDTCIHIEPKDVNNTYNIINKISKFLDQIKHAVKPALKGHTDLRRTQKPKTYLTNFLHDVAQTILNFGWDETALFFEKLYEVMKSYFLYKGSAFADIVKSSIVRRYFLETLKEWSETSPFQMKIKLRNYTKRARIERSALNRLGYFLNSYYEPKDEAKIKGLVRKLRNCTRERDFEKVIQEAVHVLIIQHYDRFNYTIRTKITDEIKRLGEHAVQRRSISGEKEFNSTNNEMDKPKNDSNIHTSTSKKSKETEHKNITVSDTQNSSSDIVVLKQNRSETSQSSNVPVESKTTGKMNVPRDVKFKASADKKQSVQRDIVYKKSKTKRRLKKLSTTTKYVPEPSTPLGKNLLKKFKLKHGPKVENATLMTTTSAPRDIKNDTSKNITSVPNDINGTTQNTATVPRAIDNVTTKNSSSQDIYNGTTHNPTLVPRGINNEVSNISSYVPRNIKNAVSDISHVPRDKNETSMKMIPVPQYIPKKALRDETKTYRTTDITSGIRVIDITVGQQTRTPKRMLSGKFNKFVPFNQENIRTISKMYVNTDNPFISNRQKYYVPPRAKLSFKETEILDIEDRIDGMHIDGK